MSEIIIQKILKEKYDSLAKREKDLVLKHFTTGFPGINRENDFASRFSKGLQENKNNFSSTIYGCIGGFVIHREFSEKSKKDFKVIIHEKKIEDFINEIPVREKSGTTFNLSKVLESTIGIRLQVRQALDIGSQGGGIKFGGLFEINGFQLIIARDNDVDDVLNDMRDIMRLDMKLKNLEKERDDLSRIIKDLSQEEEPIIISEGKTDWKHFIKALEYFHKKDQFLNLNKEWFLKFGSNSDKENSICGTDFVLENSVTELNNILQSFIDSRNFENKDNYAIRLGIFDSDDSKAKLFDSKDKKVFSLIIEPNNISTELLYSDQEIKHPIQGKRLFLGDEFDPKTKRHLTNKEFNLGGDNNNLNKAGKRKIIDNYVYDQDGNNQSISKEVFAQSVYNNEIPISDDSWENFYHIFQGIQEVLD